jgi:hypothetical protein
VILASPGQCRIVGHLRSRAEGEGGRATVSKPARRQHYAARFYLRHFAEPMFSDDLLVYDLRKRIWEERTPRGVGWSPHLCSFIDMGGRRNDHFDRFLKASVEDPAVPALKKIAMSQALTDNERPADRAGQVCGAGGVVLGAVPAVGKSVAGL